MGIRILEGIADGTTPAAALFDSVTGHMMGGIIQAPDAPEQAETFVEWTSTIECARAAVELEVSPSLDAARGISDIREYPSHAIIQLFGAWRKAHVGTDGRLREPQPVS